MTDDPHAPQRSTRRLLSSLTPELREQIIETRRLKHVAAAARDASNEALRNAVALCRGELKMSTRDTATLIGISHQRVAQIESQR